MESTVELCVSKNQKGICAVWAWLKRKTYEWDETMEKSIPELKAEFVCVQEKEISFEIHVIILRNTRNVNLPFKMDFKFAEPLTKISFFL